MPLHVPPAAENRRAGCGGGYGTYARGHNVFSVLLHDERTPGKHDKTSYHVESAHAECDAGFSGVISGQYSVPEKRDGELV